MICRRECRWRGPAAAASGGQENAKRRPPLQNLAAASYTPGREFSLVPQRWMIVLGMLHPLAPPSIG